MKSDNEFRRGLMDGIPIGLAYVAVSFAFGISGASHGIPVWALTLISATCVTSAGQFAAIITMTAGGSLVELVLSQIIINLRYSIMSIAIGQKMSEKSTLWNRLSMAFMVTDEIFAVSCAKKRNYTKIFLCIDVHSVDQLDNRYIIRSNSEYIITIDLKECTWTCNLWNVNWNHYSTGKT